MAQFYLLLLLVCSPALADDKPPAKEFLGLPLLYADDFEAGKTDRWEPTDAKAWRLTKQSENQVFSQLQQSDFKPAVRSPFNRALLKDVVVGDFVFECRVQSTARDYGHRDLCLFFGYQDDSHLYYVHLGKQADAHAHSVFLVDGAPRVSIAKKRTAGINWDDGWHTVRIVRKTKPGTIEVFFDNMKEPVMMAENDRFTSGRVGIGSFDDTGNFDDFRLWGVKVEPAK